MMSPKIHFIPSMTVPGNAFIILEFSIHEWIIGLMRWPNESL